MNERTRWILGGAAVGAMAGALAAWFLVRRVAPARPEDGTAAMSARADRGRVLRLGLAVAGVVRQLLDLA